MTLRTRQPRTFTPLRAVLLIALFILTGCGGAATTGGSPATNGAPSTVGFGNVMGEFVPVAPDVPVAPRTASGQLKVLIRYTDGATSADETIVQQKGGAVQQRFEGLHVVAASLPDEAVLALKNDPRVAAVEPDLPIHSLGVELDSAWGVNRIGAGMVHTAGNKANGIKIAVMDTGIDYTHPDLAANYAGGYDFINNDSDPMDDNGHGTHVAGIIGARDDGTGVIGVAPEARLYALKVMGANGSGSFSSVIAALQWCVTNGIQVTNCSFGSSTNPGTIVQAAYDAAQTAGIIHVAAAGNSGNASGTGSNVGFPAQYGSVIAVASTTSTDARSSFSSTGTTVEIAAPGSAITSCANGGGYVTWSGTSMASPHVAGVAALALKAGVPAASVRTRLQQTAGDLGTNGRDSLYGFGLVSASAATAVSNSAPVVTILSPSAGAVFNSAATITFSGGAADTEDGNISSRIQWTVGTNTYTGDTFSLRLSDGAYTARASVTDLGGLKHATTVRFTVANAAPVITMISPAANSTSAHGNPVTFSATALDAEDGDLTPSIVWKRGSSVVGTGGTFTTTTLPAGASTITATVTDSRRKSGSASVRVTVNPPPMTAAIVSNKAAYINNEVALLTVTTSGTGAPLSGARVSVVVTAANGSRYTSSGTTAVNGTAVARLTVRLTSMGTGLYTATVSCTKSGYQNASASTTFTAGP